MIPALETSSTHADSQRQRVEPVVARHLRTLFDCLPALAGFRLRTDLMVADVSAVSGARGTPIRRLHVSVMQALVELAECDPDAVRLMRGRAFKRCH